MAAKPIAGNGLQDELELLLAEVGALANRLKVASRAVHGRDHLLAGGKIILQSLAQSGPQTVPQIARNRSSSRQNIRVLVNRLEAGGWVEFVDNPAHKRSDLIRLTARGETLLATANAREATFLAGLLNHTTESEVLSAGELLSRLRQLVEGKQPIPVARLPKTTSAKVRARRRVEKPAVEPKPVSVAEAELAEGELPVNLL